MKMTNIDDNKPTANNVGEDERKLNDPTTVKDEKAAKMEPTPKEVAGPDPNTGAAPAPLRRGFALMDRARVRAIARKGGVSAHEKGTAHRFTREEAKEAGRKGGRAPHKSRGRTRAAKPTPPVTNGAAGNGAPAN